MKAVLFDIDGTLVSVGGAGREALIRATSALKGLPEGQVRAVIEAMDFRGGTDANLLATLAHGLGCDFETEALLALYVAELEEVLLRTPLRLMPGIAGLLSVLEARGVVVGLLTGNVRAGARCKLRPFKLDHLVDRPGGFGDDGQDRPSIARKAVARMVAAGVSPKAVVVIGDTEHDVSAARAAGAAAVAVGTGWTSMEVLQQAAPDVHLANLSDPAPILALLDRMEEEGTQ